MKNIFISEILSKKDMLVVSNQSSLADLLRAMESLEDGQHFYLVDSEGSLDGVISFHKVIEYLSMHYFLTDRNQTEALLKSLESVKADFLIDREGTLPQP